MFLLRVAAAFDAARIRYAIAGGYAVALHGAVRGTVDVDLVLRIRIKDFVNAEAALIGLGLKSRLPVTGGDVFRFREEYIRNKNLLAWSFSNPSNPTEVVDILIAENLEACKPVRMKVQGQVLHVVSVDDLIRMKSGTGRQQDAADVAALKQLKGLE